MWRSDEGKAGILLVVLTAIGAVIIWNIHSSRSDSGLNQPSSLNIQAAVLETNPLLPKTPQEPTHSETVAEPTQQKTAPLRQPSTIICNHQPVAKTALNDLGIASIKIDALCYPNTTFELKYGQISFRYKTDDTGNAKVELDLFLGIQPTMIHFDGEEKPENLTLSFPENTPQFQYFDKAAILWESPVNLDLHAYEFSAMHGDKKRHVWQGRPQSPEPGQGFLNQSNHLSSTGPNYEVYTFLRQPSGQRKGLINLRVDYESRGDTPQQPYCGDGALSSPEYRTILLRAGKAAQVRRMKIQPRPCQKPIPQEIRYLSSGFPGDLKIQ